MSWDVVMIRTKTNREGADEIKDENIIPFGQTEIAAAIKKISAQLGFAYCCDDLSWQTLDSSSWSIEFNVGMNPQTKSVMLHIRGGEPKEVFAFLSADLNTRLMDCNTGELISPDKPASFESWKAYRDQIMNVNRD